ncbi:MAG: DNA polymerase III subunit beta [Hyphomicrobiales bacterium]|nr:MAG: DNA polymerase III subunit beta [Hyphomicrobiales bacterium]
MIRKLPDGAEVSLDTTIGDGTMALTAGHSRFTLQVLPDNEFPDITAGEFSHTFSLEPDALKKLIDRTQFAISTEETRYYLNGIYLHAIEQNGELVMRAVATDGHRLALADIPAPQGCENMPGIIVPRKAVGEIQKLLDGAEDNVQLEISDSKIRISVGSVVLTSKLIDGTFPDYERVIPRNNDRDLRLDRSTFQSAVDRVSTISSERGKAVKLTLSEDQLVLSVTNPDSGTATEELAVQYAAEELEIGFNAKYLLDIANQLKSDNALFKFSDPGMPTLVYDEADTTTLFVLMPMRV